MARKSYIKIATIPRKRIKYLLTPSGITDKTRPTYEFMEYSLTYYRRMRQQLASSATALLQSGAKRIVIYGTGEVAELAYLSLAESGLKPVAFVGQHQAGSFFFCPVVPLEALRGVDFDGVLVAELGEFEAIKAGLIQAGVPEQKITPLAPKALA